MPEQQQSLTIQQAIDLGVQHHNAGDLTKAEGIYKQILQSDPDQPVALHLLGVIAHQVGKNDVAVDLIIKALAIKSDYAEAHYSLGNALKDLGKPEDAAASYHKALAIKSDYAVAHSNLGVALQDLGKPEDAVASYHKALAIKPDYADAHNNLGVALQDLGKLEDAVASYRKALALKPDLAEAHNNLGHVLGQLDRPTEAFTCHRRAISLNPQNDLFYAHFEACLVTASFASVDDNLYQDLLHLLERPVVRPSYVIRSIISALRHHPDFSRIVEGISFNQQDSEIPYRDIAGQLSTIPLFLRILELSPINDLEIERMLTVLRCAMLAETIERKTEEKVFPFSAALALQCFTNEYVFPETEEEKEAVEHLQEKIATLVEKGRPVPPSYVVALGAYRPLFEFPWTEKLNQREWENNITGVIKQQISEPLEERALRDRIPSITSIQNAISQSVREQYEENPYPRWIETSLTYESRSLGAVLTGSPLFFDLGDYTSPESPDILIAGCGTGQHPVCIASRFSNARLLAVDLSLNSLAYAERKARELGFSNIEYVQGDILELGKIERQFDLIASVGSLPTLGDPLAGWRILVNLLRPGGLMNIGLYSEIGRQDIIAGRSLIAEKGYSTSPEDIRRCRQDIIAMAEDGDNEMAKICNRNDFFSLSNCRDLLFHVQEHRFTLPQIDEALQSLKLKFLGFEMVDQRPLRMFRESYPDSHDATSLSLWHKFELKNPDALPGYPFWCQKL